MIIPIRKSTIVIGIKCGMRHPTNGLNEDDLSRLTGSSSSSSSSTASTPSHDLSHHQCTLIPIVDPNCDNNTSISNLKTSEPFNSTYLPEIIDPLEWQKSRKRKERLDSTSSTTQDRKLVRSNSEELLPNPDNDHHDEVIRRVASHEDFQKKPLHENNRDENILKTIHENENNAKHQEQNGQFHFYKNQQQQNNNVTKPSRLDTSPARSHRVSPNRDHRTGSGKYKENDDSECEHEKRRSSERFCKSRAPPGRKSGNYKRSKYISKCRDRDENAYKYDISAMKHERRGFVSKFKMEERGRKEEATDGEKIHDYNDNNLIDFHMKNDYMDLGICPVISMPQLISQQQIALPPSPGLPPPTPPPTSQTAASYKIETIAEALPWDSSVQEDQTPVLCRRFAPFEEYGTDGGSKLAAIPSAVIANEASKSSSYRSFAKTENYKTCAVMPNMATAGHFQSPEERLKWVNKRLTALKKRVTQLEETFERNYGYRPSQVDKFNDKQIKNVLAEISKLRKEKHDLKLDPMMTMGVKISGGMDAEKKVAKMKETLKEIEVKLIEKRKEGNWSENLHSLTAEQLVLEKTALQHSLLYFESLYGRPTTREERDVVRSLYDRYRIIKRLVTRSLSIAGTVSGVPELPTILEHEAMAFTVEPLQQPSVDSTDTASSPDHPQLPPGVALGNLSSDSLSDSGSNQSRADSPSEMQTSGTNPQSGAPENIHTMSVDELWEQLEKVRDEKKELKRVIKEFEAMFEVQSGRKMLKADRRTMDDTYFQYKQKKAKVRLLQALIKKHISK